MGLLQVDLRQDLMRSALMAEGEINFTRLRELFAELEREADALLEHANVPEERRRFVRQADVRYFGQSKYITIPVDDGPVDEDLVTRLIQTFSNEHARDGYDAAHIARIEIANVGWPPSASRATNDRSPAASRCSNNSAEPARGVLWRVDLCSPQSTGERR